MERPGGSCLCGCLSVLALLPALSLAQYESWPHYPEYFQQPAPEYHRPQVPSDVVKIQLRLAGQKRKHSEGRVEVYTMTAGGAPCVTTTSPSTLPTSSAGSWATWRPSPGPPALPTAKGKVNRSALGNRALGSPGEPGHRLLGGWPGKRSCSYCQVAVPDNTPSGQPPCLCWKVGAEGCQGGGQ